MADACQATFFKGEFVIHCDERWGCCQREQAQQKVQQMNRKIRKKRGKTTQKAPPMKTVNRRKNPVKTNQDTLYKITNDARRDMSVAMSQMTQSQKADLAEARGAVKCLVDAMRSANPPETQNDHELDVTICGAPNATLVPTDKVVNGMFGGIVGNQKVKPGTKITNIVLVCPKTDKCPDNSEGERTQKPTKRQQKQVLDVGRDRTTPFRSY